MPPSPSAFADALILTGPTGSGKSALALTLAEHVGGEIVAMDSMTLYRGMDIGTAKPTAQDRARVRHHLLDVLNPWESGNVAWWLEQAAAACDDIRSRGRHPLFVGGTPFYLKALLYGLFDAPPTDPELRALLERNAEDVGPTEFHARLAAVDPVSANRLHPNDVRRVVRALEVWEITGRSISSFQQTWDTPNFTRRDGQVRNPSAQPCIVLQFPREDLYRRIDARVDAMLAAGWADEVRELHKGMRPPGKEALQALGYRELFVHLTGNGPGWDETVATIKTRTRQFAKRQLTWYRSLRMCVSVPASESDVAERVLRIWEVDNRSE